MQSSNGRTFSIRNILIWGALVVAILIPTAIAATSPQLQWRGPVYIAAGFAGILAMGALLAQPLLAGNYLPGLSPRRARRVHAWVGASLAALVILHVAALWWTSSPDVVDALTFNSPTPFSDWGVIAMWATFAAGLLAMFRRNMRLRPATWKLLHLMLVTIIVIGSVVHAMLIEGTMGTSSKTAICVLVGLAVLRVVVDVKPWAALERKRTEN